MLNDYIAFEQQLRADNAHAQYENEIDAETDRINDLIAEGKFDGAIGHTPRFPENDFYWEGYSQEYRNYQLKLANKTREVVLQPF